MRRQSIDAADLFHGHIGGMDVCAQALLIAEKMVVDGRLKAAVDTRYAGWDQPAGQDILQGRRSLAELAEEVLARNTDVAPVSGRQEVLENLVNRFCG
ncbi:hypothetical protein ASC81_24905 [Pelomonas sp. Root405]|nr:hypothetical protein ASC81_24905 [Pelomonas sp. Root405]